MTGPARTLSDSATMLRRNLKHLLRYPSSTLMLVAIPVILLLLFVYIFGPTLGAGIAGSIGHGDYVQYVVPGILLMTIASAATGTSLLIAMDMTEGIIARFRTMAISRAAVLSGHVLAAMVQNGIGIALVIGVALLVGFRPTAGPLQWVEAIGLLALMSFAITWLSVALGLVSKSVETASNLPMPLILLPFLGSGFVPTDTMPAAVRWFTEYQPFTPVTETLRGLLLGTPTGDDALLAVLWCCAITVAGYLSAMALFNRVPER